MSRNKAPSTRSARQGKSGSQPARPPTVSLSTAAGDWAEAADAEANRRRTSVKLAMLFTTMLLPKPHRLGDVRLFSTGRFQHWPPFQELEPTLQRQLCRFRLLCARGLEQDSPLIQTCTEVLQDRDSFVWEAEAPTDDARDLQDSDDASFRAYLQRRFRACYPEQRSDQLTRWMQALEQSRTAGLVNAVRMERPGNRSNQIGLRQNLTLHAWDRSYSVPITHIPTTLTDWPGIVSTPFPQRSRWSRPGFSPSPEPWTQLTQMMHAPGTRTAMMRAPTRRSRLLPPIVYAPFRTGCSIPCGACRRIGRSPLLRH